VYRSHVVQKLKEIDIVPIWLPVKVWPMCWLPGGSGSGTKKAAAWKYATCQSKTTARMSISCLTKAENDEVEIVTWNGKYSSSKSGLATRVVLTAALLETSDS